MTKCIRCGKERIVKSSYTEKLEKTSVTYTVTVCSDPECQKIVDIDLKREEQNRATMREEKERRVHQRASLKLNKA